MHPDSCPFRASISFCENLKVARNGQTMNGLRANMREGCDVHDAAVAGVFKCADLADIRAWMLATYAALHRAVFDHLPQRELLAQAEDLNAMLVKPANC